ncbi:hypothetical protein ASD8599_00324 [Ascidiaceihabitans donghaensis]|uniref:Uncharacterized protein n=1 Tax=Ascidiaceihabitans donghaensis TaxID=1510460 RepID=A0A2R8B986_9RHOB|nr:hypothetical protein ASD8599_00324 [Ascidiaceihabitans donghaensis]
MSGCVRLLDCRQLTELTLVISSQARQAILERLFHRNSVRRAMGARPLNIPEAYKRKVMMLMTQEYEALLEPYLSDAFAAADWPSGFAPRLLLAVKLHRGAVRLLNAEMGISDPRTKNPDMVKMMDRHAPCAEVTNYIRTNL